MAKEFPNEKALKEYLYKHPNADKSKHKVVEDDLERIKRELKPTQDIQKGQEKSDKGKAKRKDDKAKKDESDKADKLKKDLKKHQEDFPEGSVRSEPKKPEPSEDKTEEEGETRRKKIKERNKSAARVALRFVNRLLR